jgi:IS30 family transposase
MSTRPSHRSAWSESEILQLRQGFAEGVPARDLAFLLGRTEEAIRRKHRILSRPKSDQDPAAYFEGRAAEERRRAAESDDPRVASIHRELARRYDEAATQTNDTGIERLS